jgi:hypothetical protein
VYPDTQALIFSSARHVEKYHFWEVYVKKGLSDMFLLDTRLTRSKAIYNSRLSLSQANEPNYDL